MSGTVKINIPIIVEGKYDKAHLSSVVDGVIITTSGFGIFKNDEKKKLIKTLGKNGIIILSDSDGGGSIIRSHLKGLLGGIRVYDLYVPQIVGKERRKKELSKAGFLGVEGIECSILREIFEKFASAHPELCEGVSKDAKNVGGITAALMLELGLTGGENSAARRDALCAQLALPAGMSSKALCEAMNMLISPAQLYEILEKL